MIKDIAHASWQIIKMRVARMAGNEKVYFDSLCAFWGQFDKYEKQGLGCPE